MASPNTNFDQLVTTTLHNYLSTDLADNVFGPLVLAKWLMANGRKRPASGGDFLVEPILYQANSTVKSIDGYEPVDTSPQAGITAAQFNWKMLAGSVTYSRLEMLKNNSKEKIIDLLEQKVVQLEESLRNEFNTEAYADGTGNSGKNVTGLQAICSNSGVFAGIDRTANTWWQAVVDSQNIPLNESDMRKMFNNVSQNLTKPTVIITDQTMYQKYESMVLPAYRTTNTKMGDLGFMNLEFKGVPIVWDPACPAGFLFYLNDNFLKLRVHPEADFKATERKEPSNQLVWTQQVFWLGNLTCNNSRFQGVMQGPRTV